MDDSDSIQLYGKIELTAYVNVLERELNRAYPHVVFQIHAQSVGYASGRIGTSIGISWDIEKYPYIDKDVVESISDRCMESYANLWQRN